MWHTTALVEARKKCLYYVRLYSVFTGVVERLANMVLTEPNSGFGLYYKKPRFDKPNRFSFYASVQNVDRVPVQRFSKHQQESHVSVPTLLSGKK